MKIEEMRISDLIPYENNTKIHPPAQVEQIAESIKRFGWQQPIVVDKDNVVIIGHGRLLAAQEMGLETAPVVRAEMLSDADVKALRLADNKLNESPWDFSRLEQELASLAIDGIDMEQFGFDITEPETNDDNRAELPENYQIVIDCENEQEAEEKYNMITEIGIECRISTL